MQSINNEGTGEEPEVLGEHLTMGVGV